jgi:uncharacterized protein (DUF697 family)
MATVPAANQITRLVNIFRDKINFSSIDERARRPVHMLATGPWAEELAALLEHERAAPAPLVRVWQHEGPAPAHDAALRCILVAASAVADNDAAIARCISLGIPVFVMERHSGVTACANKPSAGIPGRYSLANLDAHELHRFVLPDIVDACGDADVALAAALPIFRPTVAARLTVDCAITSLKVAGASALADHVPVLGLVLGGIASAGDTIAITGLQMNMLLHIAAAYGRKAEFARLLELVPVVGGGYGWRALARELSGFIPVAGIAVKAGIAYAGTLVVGQAAAYYYETGSPMGAEKIGALYRESIERAKKLAGDVIERFRTRKATRQA